MIATENRASTTSLPYNRAIDGLRAVAILAVLAGHGSHGHIPGGFMGVEMFFVLSGFLITSVLLTGWRRDGRTDFGRFYLRRATRLLPALLAVIAGVYVLYAADGDVISVKDALGDLPLVLLYAGNWAQYVHPGNLGLLSHTWSLAIEEQFYLVWPLVLTFMLRRGFSVRRMLAATLAAAGLSAALRVVLWLAYGYPTYFRSDTRAAALMAGCALALALTDPGLRAMVSRYASQTAATVALAVIGLAVLGAKLETDSTFVVLFLVVDVAAVVVLAHVVTSRTRLTAFLGHPALVWVGARSYGLYLIHYPIFRYTDLRWTSGKASEAVLRFLLTFALAELSWRFIEQPLLKRRRAPVLHAAPLPESA